MLHPVNRKKGWDFKSVLIASIASMLMSY